MGIPKFYRWVSERYPCLSEVVKEHQIPEFDNLYFDMNGIIHTCSHPNDDDPHFRITEEQIFKDIFHYIEVLFRIIRPKRTFFMAVDGVAPRAKMNQQRGRRFMSAYTALQLAEEAKRKGEVLPTEERFDSNCITPGTTFMTKLHEQLKYFVRMKITTDEMWRGINIYLSGHDVPGEGEHKIMDFIRYSRSQENYDPNTRHCLYGLDADLIMLGMVSHEPHFSLLREEVKFVRPTKNQKGRTVNPDQTKFHLLHLSLFREYLDFEFSVLKDKITFPYELEKVIDDWVMMGFLVGNDFIPHLPHLHIHEDALPRLYRAYSEILPTLDGYINEGGLLNLPRFEKFMVALSQLDRDHFSDEMSDLKWLDGKSRTDANCKDIREFQKNKKSNDRKTCTTSKKLTEFEMSDDDDLDDGMSEELKKLIKKTSEILVQPKDAEGSKSDDSSSDESSDSENKKPSNLRRVNLDDLDFDSDEWTSDMEQEFKEHKKNYYKDKMDYRKVTKEVLHDQAVKYVTAIQWNLHYYYDGCRSWSWYYPHHYAPYLSDVKGFSDLKLEFDLGKPFLPFQQLLAVLPAGSRKLLPEPFQDLMTKETSPIIDFYPSNFDTDLNGKKNDWEAVVLIPLIEEDRLIQAMAPLLVKLSDDEKRRNSHGNHLLFTTSSESLGVYSSSLPGVFPDLINNFAKCLEVNVDLFRIPREKTVRGLLSGVQLDVYFAGFPTFKHIPIKFELKKTDVKVFQANSKNESIVVKIEPRQDFESDVEMLAKRMIGQEVYINWPHLALGLVTSLLTKESKFTVVEEHNDGVVNKNLKKFNTNQTEKRQFDKDEEFLNNRYFQNRAVDVGNVDVLVYVKPLVGRKFYSTCRDEITLEKEWGDRPAAQILQTIVENLNVHDPSYHQYKSLKDVFPTNAEVFVLGVPFYGYQGTIVSNVPENKKLKVKIASPVEPDISRVIEQEHRLKLFWFPARVAAAKLNVSGHFLSRITGTVYMEETRPPNEEKDESLEEGSKSSDNKNGGRANRYHIGLNLKFNKKNEEVPDYTKKDGEGVWLYSTNVLRILDEYGSKFPEIFNYMLNVSCKDDIFFADEVWPPVESKTKLKELTDYLKGLPCHNAQHQLSGTEVVDERMIRALETEVAKANEINHQTKKAKTVAVRPEFLFRTCLYSGRVLPDTKVEYQLYDRVVNVREGFTVPIGLRGTVIAIHIGQSETDMKLDVIFDEEFFGGILLRGTKKSGYSMPSYALINLTYGIRFEAVKNGDKSNSEQKSLAEFSPVWKNISSAVKQNKSNVPAVHNVAASRNVPNNAPPIPVVSKALPTIPVIPIVSTAPAVPTMATNVAHASNVVSNVPVVQNVTGDEFIKKFAQPSCLVSPQVCLPSDPHSAFNQVRPKAKVATGQPSLSVFGQYNASDSGDRQTVWQKLMETGGAPREPVQFSLGPMPSQTQHHARPPVPTASQQTVPVQSVVFNNSSLQFVNSRLFHNIPPPPQPVFSQMPSQPVFNQMTPQQVLNPMSTTQQMLNQMSTQHVFSQIPPPPPPQMWNNSLMHQPGFVRPNLHQQQQYQAQQASGNFQMFVPLQVTKKQPAPAYVRGPERNASSNANTPVKAPNNASSTLAFENHTVSNNGPKQVNSNSANAPRNKRTSRLAANFSHR